MKLIKVKCVDGQDKLIMKKDFAPGITILIYKIYGRDLYRFEITGPQLHYFDRQDFTSKDRAFANASEYAKKAARKLHR